MKSLLAIVKRLKRRLYTAWVLKKAGIDGESVYVNGRSSFTKRTRLGRNTHFNGMEISGSGNVVIGNNFHSGSECMIISSIHNYDMGMMIPYDNTSIDKDVVIKDNVWLGKRVIILPGVTIGEGAIIQAGSCVTTDIPDFSIAGGHPAKVFKQRNIEHYQGLKSAKKFF